MNPALTISERAFQNAVIEAAQIAQWRVAHFRPAKTERMAARALTTGGRNDRRSASKSKSRQTPRTGDVR